MIFNRLFEFCLYKIIYNNYNNPIHENFTNNNFSRPEIKWFQQQTKPPKKKKKVSFNNEIDIFHFQSD